MKQSFLINDRIYLRAVEPEDMDVMYEMENDPSMWDISNFTVRRMLQPTQYVSHHLAIFRLSGSNFHISYCKSFTTVIQVVYN
jgi:RimJ/RimL family protein N-acetyltransferase